MGIDSNHHILLPRKLVVQLRNASLVAVVGRTLVLFLVQLPLQNYFRRGPQTVGSILGTRLSADTRIRAEPPFGAKVFIQIQGPFVLNANIFACNRQKASATGVTFNVRGLVCTGAKPGTFLATNFTLMVANVVNAAHVCG